MLDQAALHHLGMRQDFRHAQHLAGGNALGVEQRRPFGRGFFGQGRFELGPQLEAVELAILTADETWIVDQLRPADQAGQGLELLLLVGGDVEQALAGVEGAGGRRRHVLVAHRHRADAGDQPVGNSPAHGDEGRFQHRHVDPLALAGPLLLDEGGRNGEGGGDAAHGVADRVANPQRCGVGRAGDTHDTGQSLDDLVVGGIVAQRAVHAEAGDGAIDHVRLDLAQLVIAEAEPVHDARTEILDDSIGGGHQPAKQLLAGGGLQIDGDRALAGVLRQERHAHQPLVQFGIGTELACQVADARHLDLDHVRTQHRQLVAGEGPGQHVGQIENADAVQGPRHLPPRSLFEELCLRNDFH